MELTTKFLIPPPSSLTNSNCICIISRVNTAQIQMFTNTHNTSDPYLEDKSSGPRQYKGYRYKYRNKIPLILLANYTWMKYSNCSKHLGKFAISSLLLWMPTIALHKNTWRDAFGNRYRFILLTTFHFKTYSLNQFQLPQ